MKGNKIILLAKNTNKNFTSHQYLTYALILGTLDIKLSNYQSLLTT